MEVLIEIDEPFVTSFYFLSYTLFGEDGSVISQGNLLAEEADLREVVPEQLISCVETLQRYLNLVWLSVTAADQTVARVTLDEWFTPFPWRANVAL